MWWDALSIPQKFTGKKAPRWSCWCKRKGTTGCGWFRVLPKSKSRSGVVHRGALRFHSGPSILFLMNNGLTHMLQEVDDFLMGESKVHRTLDRIARHLDELGIDFALAGGLAIGLRGHLRVTVDVDILITAEG